MKKVLVTGVVVLLLAALLAGAGLVAGCGGSSSTGGDQTPTKVLEESNKKMESVKSFKADGTYSINMGGTEGSSTGTEASSVSFEMQVQMKGVNNYDARMVMKGMGDNVDVYIRDGYAYYTVAGTGWVKQKMNETSNISAFTPTEMKEFSKEAENLRFLPSDNEYYKVAFDVSSEFFEKSLSQEGVPEGIPPQYAEMMEQVVKGMKMGAEFTINKKTMYLEDADLKITTGSIPQIGNMVIVMKMVMSDYNKPVNVALPPEAAGAQEVPAGEEGVPGLPGLTL